MDTTESPKPPSLLSTPRVQHEIQILRRFFPAFRWYTWSGIPFTEGPVRTNSDATYTIRVRLRADHPAAMPLLVVTAPKPLLAHGGEALGASGASHAMHVHGANTEGLFICHGIPGQWTPAETVYKVVVKARVWLEAYELHVATGEPIAKYLRNQES